MQFPTMLYRCPGLHQCPGGTFSTIGAADQTAFDQHVAAGWHPTMPEAMAPKKPVVVVASDNAPPTRAELETKAKELGIAFDGRTGDKTIAGKIADALKV